MRTLYYRIISHVTILQDHILQDHILRDLSPCIAAVPCALLSQCWPASLATPQTHAFAFPREQQARERAGRCAVCVDRAGEEEPVAGEHIKIIVLEVVLAAREVGEEAPRVVVVLRGNAELIADRLVHEAGVTQVAVQEGTGSEALPVGELGRVEYGPSLLVGPPLQILAAHDVQDALVRVVRHHDPNPSTDTCG